MISGAHWLARTEQDDLGPSVTGGPSGYLDPEVISEVIKFADFARGPGLNGKQARRARGSRHPGAAGLGEPAPLPGSGRYQLRRCGEADLLRSRRRADLPAVRAARHAVIDTDRPPASTAVQVDALFAPGYLLEVEAWGLAGD